MFYPKHPIRIGGFNWESPFQKWFNTINLNDFFPPKSQEKQLEQIMPFIDAKLDDFFRNKLPQKMPMVSMFVGDKTISQLKGVFLDELNELFPGLIVLFTENIQQEMLNKWQEGTTKTLENRIKKQIKPLQWAGLFIGFAWGVIAYLLNSLI
jgi:hypothetical protein